MEVKSKKLTIKSSLSKRAGKMLRNLDSFGHPVTLTYNNKSEYQSIFGGVASLILNIGVFIYAMLLFSQTVSKKTYLVSTSTSKVDLYDGLNHTLVLNKDNFDISY